MFSGNLRGEPLRNVVEISTKAAILALNHVPFINLQSCVHSDVGVKL